MSLEQKIEELTAALVENTAVSKALIAVRTEAIETVKNAAASGTKKAEVSKAKVEPKTEEPGSTAVETAMPEEDAYAEAKALTEKFVTGSDRKEEQQARKDLVRTLLRHPKLVKADLADPTKFSTTDVQESMIPVLIKNLKAAIERGDITQPVGADADNLL